MSISLATTTMGKISFQNKSNCKISPQFYTSDNSPLKITPLEDTFSYEVIFTGTNTKREYNFPVLLQCPAIQSIAVVTLLAQPTRIEVSAKAEGCFSSASLIIQGDNKLDNDNKEVTLVVLPSGVLDQ